MHAFLSARERTGRGSMPTKLCMRKGVCFSMSAYDTPCGSRYTALCARPASGGGFVCCEHVDRNPYAVARIITQRVGDDVAAVVATTNGRVLDMAVSSDGTSAVHTCVDGVCLRSLEDGQILHAIDYGAWEPRRVWMSRLAGSVMSGVPTMASSEFG